MILYLYETLDGALRDERGTVTPFALFMMLVLFLFSGLSVDSNNAWRVKYMLQVAADAAAHAAALELPDEDAALAAAMEVAALNLPSGENSTAIQQSDIRFGSWDEDNQIFDTNAATADAVWVTAGLIDANSNALPTFFLRLAGFKSWNVQIDAVSFRKESLSGKKCQGDAIVTNGDFEMTSNNDVFNGYCIHGAEGIKFGNNNTYDDDVILSVEDFDDIDFPGSVGMSTTVGRGTSSSSASLTYGDIFEENSISANYVDDVDSLGDDFLNPFYSGQPSYINTAAAVIELDANDVKYTDFIPGRIYEIVCGGSSGSKAQFYSGAEVSQVVIVSECRLQLGSNSIFEDVVLVSRDTGSKSVKASEGVILGADDSCGAGGEVSIYSAGNVKSADNVFMFGLSISAVGDVELSAASDGVEGLNIQANGDVKMAADTRLGLCPGAISNEGEATYAFKIVR